MVAWIIPDIYAICQALCEKLTPNFFLTYAIHLCYYIPINKREVIRMSVGERIKRVRNFRGLSQRELGIRAGFDESTADVRINQYEPRRS